MSRRLTSPSKRVRDVALLVGAVTRKQPSEGVFALIEASLIQRVKESALDEAVGMTQDQRAAFYFGADQVLGVLLEHLSKLFHDEVAIDAWLTGTSY